MSKLTRRTVLAGTAAAALAPVLSPATTHAAAPAAGKQAPGFYRYKLGDFEITVISDGVWVRKLEETTVPGVPFAELQKAFADDLVPAGTFPLPFSPVVVNTGSKLVLLDTNTGGRSFPTAGTYMENLTAAGIDPKAVDLVVISHFHADHINGIWTKDDQMAFPNAEIMVPEPEWAFWMDDAKMSAAPEGMKGAFNNVRRVFGPIAAKVTRYQPGKAVAPGITTLATYGHTPGHTGFIVTSGNQSLMHLVDAVIYPTVWLRHPEWPYPGDVDKPLGIETRKRLLDRVAADKMMI